MHCQSSQSGYISFWRQAQPTQALCLWIIYWNMTIRIIQHVRRQRAELGLLLLVTSDQCWSPTALSPPPEPRTDWSGDHWPLGPLPLVWMSRSCDGDAGQQSSRGWWINYLSNMWISTTGQKYLNSISAQVHWPRTKRTPWSLLKIEVMWYENIFFSVGFERAMSRTDIYLGNRSGTTEIFRDESPRVMTQWLAVFTVDSAY